MTYPAGLATGKPTASLATSAKNPLTYSSDDPRPQVSTAIDYTHSAIKDAANAKRLVSLASDTTRLCDRQPDGSCQKCQNDTLQKRGILALSSAHRPEQMRCTYQMYLPILLRSNELWVKNFLKNFCKN